MNLSKVFTFIALSVIPGLLQLTHAETTMPKPELVLTRLGTDSVTRQENAEKINVSKSYLEKGGRSRYFGVDTMVLVLKLEKDINGLSRTTKTIHIGASTKLNEADIKAQKKMTDSHEKLLKLYEDLNSRHVSQIIAPKEFTDIGGIPGIWEPFRVNIDYINVNYVPRPIVPAYDSSYFCENEHYESLGFFRGTQQIERVHALYMFYPHLPESEQAIWIERQYPGHPNSQYLDESGGGHMKVFEGSVHCSKTDKERICNNEHSFTKTPRVLTTIGGVPLLVDNLDTTKMTFRGPRFETEGAKAILSIDGKIYKLTCNHGHYADYSSGEWYD